MEELLAQLGVMGVFTVFLVRQNNAMQQRIDDRDKALIHQVRANDEIKEQLEENATKLDLILQRMEDQ